MAAYEKETGKKFEFTITIGSDPETAKTAALVQTYLQQVGIKASTQVIGDQTQYISQAIGKKFQAIFWRNYPGADPDTLWVWWHCDNSASAATDDCMNPVNFAGFNDPVINENLEKGRAELDEAKRVPYYEAINKRFAEQLWAPWSQWTLWNISSKPGVWGLWGPKLPDGTNPSEGLATGIPVQRDTTPAICSGVFVLRMGGP